MVCIHCGAKTHVTNSRAQKRLNQVWRRRQCWDCGAIFTTEESPQYALSWTVWDGNGIKPFSRDKLFLSLHNCLLHRPDPIKDAAELANTITAKLPEYLSDTSTLTPRKIRQVVQVALNRFDKAASVQYQALHNR